MNKHVVPQNHVYCIGINRIDGLKVIDADTLAMAWEKFQVHVKQTTNHKNTSECKNNECTQLCLCSSLHNNSPSHRLNITHFMIVRVRTREYVNEMISVAGAFTIHIVFN